MAKKFRHCQTLGIDLVLREFDEDQKLPNLSFEVHDVNHGLDKFHSQFDLIHVRLLQAGTKDFVRFQHDVDACLKPGGMVVFIDGDWRTLTVDGITAAKLPETDESGYAIEPTIGSGRPNAADTKGGLDKPSWLRKISIEVVTANYLAGAFDTRKYITDRGIWHHPLMDPDTAFAASLLIPVGPWATGRHFDVDHFVMSICLNCACLFI